MMEQELDYLEKVKQALKVDLVGFVFIYFNR